MGWEGIRRRHDEVVLRKLFLYIMRRTVPRLYLLCRCSFFVVVIIFIIFILLLYIDDNDVILKVIIFPKVMLLLFMVFFFFSDYCHCFPVSLLLLL